MPHHAPTGVTAPCVPHLRPLHHRAGGAPTRRTALAATGVVAALALTATACNGSGDSASDKPDGTITASASGGDGKIRIPADIASKLKDHGIDIDQWAKGGWKDWDRDKWLRAAKDFANPVIEGAVEAGADEVREGGQQDALHPGRGRRPGRQLGRRGCRVRLRRPAREA
jgi:hypothetical protein